MSASLLALAQVKKWRSGQAAAAVGGPGGQERLEVAGAGGGPVVLASPCEEDCHVADGAQAALDGLVGAGAGAGPAGTLAGVEQVLAESGRRGAQRSGDGIDQVLAAGGRQLGGLVLGQGQAAGGEEVTQDPGQVRGPIRRCRPGESVQAGHGGAGSPRRRAAAPGR